MYDPAQHYWLVGNKTGKVFSSSLPGYVDAGDPAYAAWVAAGGTATRILCDGELAHVLHKAGVAPPAIAAAGASALGALSPAETLELVGAMGLALSSTATPALDATYEISGQAWADMREEAQYIATFGAFSGGEESFAWPARGDVVVSFPTTAEFLAVVRGLADYLTRWKRYLASGGTAPAFGSVTIA